MGTCTSTISTEKSGVGDGSAGVCCGALCTGVAGAEDVEVEGVEVGGFCVGMSMSKV